MLIVSQEHARKLHEQAKEVSHYKHIYRLESKFLITEISGKDCYEYEITFIRQENLSIDYFLISLTQYEIAGKKNRKFWVRFLPMQTVKCHE